MRVQPLVLSVRAGSVNATGGERSRVVSGRERQGGDVLGLCRFCGGPIFIGQERFHLDDDHSNQDCGISASSCPLCHLTQHLERPEIDREATLIWLPEVTQGVLNALVWDIHLTLAKHGRPLCLDRLSFSAPPPARVAASAYAALKDRGLAALRRIGTTSPRDLAEALLRLSPSSYDRRAELLGGARLLPLGRFLWNGRDVYPQLVETLKSNSKRQDISAARRFQEKDLTQ